MNVPINVFYTERKHSLKCSWFQYSLPEKVLCHPLEMAFVSLLLSSFRDELGFPPLFSILSASSTA